MAESMLSKLGIGKDVVAKVEAQEVSEGSAIPSGVYDAAVDQAFIRKTQSGANQLEVDFILEGGKTFHWSTNVLSGDEKGNKSTWTVTEKHKWNLANGFKLGQEVTLPGVIEMASFLTAIDTLDPGGVEGKAKYKDEQIDALCMTGVQGKRLKLGVNQEESLFNGDVFIRNAVKYWMDADGKNKEGKAIEERARKNLEKNPLKKLKIKGGASVGTPAATTAAPAAGSGW